jgi:hypothetical protein
MERGRLARNKREVLNQSVINRQAAKAQRAPRKTQMFGVVSCGLVDRIL